MAREASPPVMPFTLLKVIDGDGVNTDGIGGDGSHDHVTHTLNVGDGGADLSKLGLRVVILDIDLERRRNVDNRRVLHRHMLHCRNRQRHNDASGRQRIEK